MRALNRAQYAEAAVLAQGGLMAHAALIASTSAGAQAQAAALAAAAAANSNIGADSASAASMGNNMYALPKLLNLPVGTGIGTVPNGMPLQLSAGPVPVSLMQMSTGMMTTAAMIPNNMGMNVDTSGTAGMMMNHNTNNNNSSYDMNAAGPVSIDFDSEDDGDDDTLALAHAAAAAKYNSQANQIINPRKSTANTNGITSSMPASASAIAPAPIAIAFHQPATSSSLASALASAFPTQFGH
jgi:hypothetical protein